MIDQRLIQSLVKEEDLVVPTLFKPVQFSIIKKLDAGMRLTDNEKRYLRGKMGRKINALQGLISIGPIQDGCSVLLNSIGSCYITGLEALRHNGYGWYFEPKVIEVINTKIQGKAALKGKTIKFIRVKSITNSKISIDKETGLKYAANEQILKDITFTKNEYARNVWRQMLERYSGIFVKGYNKLKMPAAETVKIDYSHYGV